ncbi:hypothetical protein FPV67DRAFT_1430943 [Lyophyllum atratum]|nr:hypothetical protein FPV67DRAFT_1430943 [Lyophyllum atratum]
MSSLSSLSSPPPLDIPRGLPPSPLPPSSPPLPSSPFIPPPELADPKTPRRHRASSLPPISSDGLIYTSPITGATKAERIAKARSKSLRKRAATLRTRLEERALEETRVVEETMRAERAAAEKKERRLQTLRQHEYMSDPLFKQGQARWDHLFRDRTSIPKLLNLWSLRSSPASRQQVNSWAVEYVSREVKREARDIAASKYLQTRNRTVDAAMVLGFKMTSIAEYLQRQGPILMKILQSIATSPRHLKNASPVRLAKKLNVITSTALALLGEYSYSNNWPKKVMGLYLYSTGSQRQPLSVMSHVGISESYNAIIAKRRQRKKKTAGVDPLALIDPELAAAAAEEVFTETKGGSLPQLSRSMIDVARRIAASGLFATSYDNINMVFRAAEQIVGRTDAQENGTCATMWPLFKACLEDMLVSDVEKAFDNAPPLILRDVLLNDNESRRLRMHVTHCILRIIVAHGGEGFKKFQRDLERTTPCTPEKIELNETSLHPLPAFDIDESTIVGGAQVVDAIFELLGIKKLAGWTRTVKFFCGDQLTIARLRSLVNIRAGHEGGYTGFGWGVWIPGLFHAKMADIHGVLLTHFGNPTAGSRNPGSLSFHNTVLQRKPIVLTSLPPFRTCRDLIFVSLYARVLHCLLLISKTTSLEECGEDLTWDQLELYAQDILDKFANPNVVADLRWRRTQAEKLYASQENSNTASQPSSTMPRDGDMVFENAVLFLRDALLSREFTDAVKAGDSGRVVLVLKTWALSFRGSGRTKYAHEMLHLIHNLTSVWPKGIRQIVLNNWLINPTGKPNSFIEVDLMQEHMNFWIKNFYRAHGSAASWEWLEMIAPCVNILRQLARNFKQMLGTDLGTAHHPMDLTIDLPDLMESLDHHEVYCEKKGRYFDGDDTPVPNIISDGLHNLITGPTNPLSDYVKAFLRLQARRRLTPLVGVELLPSNNSPAIANLPCPSSPAPTASQPDINTGLPDLPTETHEVAVEEDEEQDEQLSEFLQSFEVDAEPSLALETAADVSLDMDIEDTGSMELGDMEEDDEDSSDEGSDSGLKDDDVLDAS